VFFEEHFLLTVCASTDGPLFTGSDRFHFSLDITVRAAKGSSSHDVYQGKEAWFLLVEKAGVYESPSELGNEPCSERIVLVKTPEEYLR
jgi:hypothetical protein